MKPHSPTVAKAFALALTVAAILIATATRGTSGPLFTQRYFRVFLLLSTSSSSKVLVLYLQCSRLGTSFAGLSDLGDTFTDVSQTTTMSSVEVTVTDRVMTVVAHGDIAPGQWAQILGAHDLLDATIATVDYEIEDYPAENPAHMWHITFGGEYA